MTVVFTVIPLLLFFLYIVEKILHLSTMSLPPFLYYTASKYNNSIIKECSTLTESYVPPALWGKSGHIQTIIYAKMGRVQSPYPRGQRHSVKLPDGTALTFDIFEPLTEHPSDGDYTILVCPGIANSSECVYIRTFIDYAQKAGYRVAVLNHLGALKNVPLTTPRIYTYGGTEEYATMVEYVQERYSQSGLIAVGFSMGGNIVTKYLGEDMAHQSKIICGMSVCQGYDVIQAEQHLLSWEHLGRLYNYFMTLHQRKTIRRHRPVLLGKDAIKRFGLPGADDVLSCTSLISLDELYSRRRAGFENLKEYYEWCSSSNFINNIQIPMFILNAKDDPLIPEAVLDIPRKFAMLRDNVIFALTTHGGHLGFFEGGVLGMHPITWLEKVVIQLAHAHIKLSAAKV